MTARWRIVPAAAPALRKWGDEYVVHHALSNDTYRLSAAAGRILAGFMTAEGCNAAGVGGAKSPDDAEVSVALAVLAELGFVTRC